MAILIAILMAILMPVLMPILRAILMAIFMAILLTILMAILMGIWMEILMGILMMVSIGWPYDSSDCLLYLILQLSSLWKSQLKRLESRLLFWNLRNTHILERSN